MPAAGFLTSTSVEEREFITVHLCCSRNQLKHRVIGKGKQVIFLWRCGRLFFLIVNNLLPRRNPYYNIRSYRRINNKYIYIYICIRTHIFYNVGLPRHYAGIRYLILHCTNLLKCLIDCKLCRDWIERKRLLEKVMSCGSLGLFSSCKNTGPHTEEIATNNVRLFSYNALRSATRDFHPSNKIGRGGFGVVFRGILRDGNEVAVKCLSAKSKQGINEFLTEMNMISSIHHPNLVELIGCCVEGSHRILVYGYLENNSLSSVLLGSKTNYVVLDWHKRASICLGTASGLAFLHEEAEPPIVHRDIKASNILLDGNLNPKIGDFGLAKLFPDNITHVSTRVAGTVGYLAPEYALLGQLTKRADVYSFGVLLLEIISGKSSSKAGFGEDLMLLVEWAWKLREDGRLLDLVDPELSEYPEDEVVRFIKVALFCTQAAPSQRPGMKQVVEMLSKEVTLNEKLLTEPGIFRAHNTQPPISSSSANRTQPLASRSLTSTQLDSRQFTQMLPR